ncbi:MAG TPA: hypothetical protein VNM14_20150 [Planctomycetota bacterium]|nr:hypothetical protein [Planctomycetota bacterium]
MSDHDPRAPGFPWGATLTGLLVLIILGAGVGTPMLLKSRREARIRDLYGALREMASIQSDYFRNDRDGNRIMDFWTGDLASLQVVRSARDGSELRLLRPSLARADTMPILPPSTAPESFEGYLFRALDKDNNRPDWIYRVDTDGSGRKVHNTERFGICAHPEEGGADRPIFIINEYHTIWHRSDGKLHFNWPDDNELKYNYSRFDY